MPEIVLYAIIYFTLALIFYSIGVWSERLQKTLKPWHLLFFWLGLIADTLGTIYVKQQVGILIFNLHTLTGMLGLMFMIIHAIWATTIIIKKDPNKLYTFHKFSLLVWFIWLIPYFTGLISGMTR
ncbi:TIGR03987 family protein [bacterium SCSIO 12643]|nr:TIGR03987 family protein [bacterium SCSIO 12643]